MKIQTRRGAVNDTSVDPVDTGSPLLLIFVSLSSFAMTSLADDAFCFFICISINASEMLSRARVRM